MKKLSYISFRITIVFRLFCFFILLLLFYITIVLIKNELPITICLVAFLIFGLLVYSTYQYIYKPYMENTKILKLFALGYTVEGIYNQKILISPEMELAINKLRELMNTGELIEATKKQAEYLALQNQINPHFLYNTLEGIRGEALIAGLDTIADMMEALSTFFRYTISNIENLVSLEDELSNVENYFKIQKYRFGERLELKIVYDEKDEKILMNSKLPKLTLQPIIENAILHGTERKIGKGIIEIKIECCSQYLFIILSDNGIGMDEKTLNELNTKLNQPSYDYMKPGNNKKGGIAMTNVNNRMKLMFGEDFGMSVCSTLNVGTDVEIILPFIDGNGQIKNE